jgi:poly(ADP-ribose) glycohydrolase
MSSPARKRAKVLRQTSLKDIFQPLKSEKLKASDPTTEKNISVIPDSPPNKISSSPKLSREHTPDGISSEVNSLEVEAMAESFEDAVEEAIEDFEDTSTLDSTLSDTVPEELGCPLHQLNFGPSTYPVLPPLVEAIDHCVTIHRQLPKDAPPIPFPDRFRDVWDSNHVRMPCSKNCLYPVEGSIPKELRPKWDLIKYCLSKPIRNSQQLEAAILVYNSRQRGKWNFDSLHAFFQKADDVYCNHFFTTVLPRVIDLALSLPNVVTHALPLVRQQMDYTITMSQKQAACLLANAFLCTYPNRNSFKSSGDFSNFPSINFNTLFSGPFQSRQEGKLKCIFHYFDRVTSEIPIGTVSFHRQVLANAPEWNKCDDTVTKLHVTSSQMIEDIGIGMLQVDFANRFIGGGVLGRGCVQEEIRFMVCPELIVSRLFTESLADNECMIVTGCEQYSYYKGYADTFKWSGYYSDETLRDDWGRRCVQLVAIDALVFRGKIQQQFSQRMCLRELNKAYCGFLSTQPGVSGSFPAVATGNWGCGAFHGDVYLKSMLQIMAAAKAKRDVVYTTFGNHRLAHKLVEVHQILADNKVTVAQLWNIVMKFSPKLADNLFSYIKDYYKKEGESQSLSLSQTLEY